MMAFFLILWLLSMVAPEKQALVSQYFQHFSIFERSGNSILDGSSNLREKVKKQTFHKGEQENVKKAPVLSINDPSIEPIPQENIQKKIREEVEKKLTNLKDQVLVDFFEGGVKIEMVDKVGSPMFPLGSSQLSPAAKEIISVITGDINSTNAKVAIEGHTDALSYSTSRYTNWELSTERASAARRELENNGLNPDRIIRVSGHAATVPFIKDDPLDPRNRRICILVFTEFRTSEIKPVSFAAAEPVTSQKTVSPLVAASSAGGIAALLFPPERATWPLLKTAEAAPEPLPNEQYFDLP